MAAKDITRVLVIDDSQDILNIATALIQSLHADPTAASDAQSGIALVEKMNAAGTPFDLILLDIRMPNIDGYAAAEQIRAKGYKGKIVVFTANATMQGKRKGQGVGIDSYLSKSVLNKEVIAALLAEVS